VEFEYFDDALAAGLAVSVAAALACLAMVLLDRRRRSRVAEDKFAS
jgi:hypothetical protein